MGCHRRSPKTDMFGLCMLTLITTALSSTDGPLKLKAWYPLLKNPSEVHNLEEKREKCQPMKHPEHWENQSLAWSLEPDCICVKTAFNYVEDQGHTFSNVLVRVEGENDNGPSFGNNGKELILCVPENVNYSYVIVTLQANDSDGLNAVIQYSLTNDSSDAFCINDMNELRVCKPEELYSYHVFKLTVKAKGVNKTSNDSYLNIKANDSDGLNAVIQYSLTNDSSDAFCINDMNELRVCKPEELYSYHVFKLTVKAKGVNKTSNDSYLNIKIFVVDNIYDFVLPSKLPAATLTKNCQYVIEELSKILGLRLTLVKVGEHKAVDSYDSDRSELVFQAFEFSANDTVPVNTSEIGIKVAGSSEKIASLFELLASVWNSTDVSASSQYTVNSLSEILIAVACLLLVVTLVAVITACRPWKRFSCCRRRDNLSDETSLSMDNWHFGDNTSIKSSHVSVSEFHEHRETSEFTKTSQLDFAKISQPDFTMTSQLDFTTTSQLEKPLMFETHDTSFPFDAETHSLGLNTVARREHARDQQMQRMQQLFQAVGSTMDQSKHHLYPKLDAEEHQEESPSNTNDKQHTYLLGLRSNVSEPAKPRPAVIQVPDLGTPKLNTQGIGTSRSSPYPSILSKKDGKHEFVTSKEHESVQHSSTPVLDSARSSVVLPQIPNSQVTNQRPPFEDSSTSQMLSTHTREDEQNVKPTHKSDQNNGLPLATLVKSGPDEPSLVDLHNVNPGVLKEQMEGEADSQWSFTMDIQDLVSLSQDFQHEGVQDDYVQDEDDQDEDDQDEDDQDEDVQDEDAEEVLSAEDAVTHF